MHASRQVLARKSVRRILRHRTFRVKNPRHRRWDGFADLCFCSFVRQGEINVPLDFHRCLRGRSDDAHCDCESQEALTRTLGSTISVKFLWKLAKIFHDASPLLHRKKTKPFLLKQIGLLSCWGCRLVTLVRLMANSVPVTVWNLRQRVSAAAHRFRRHNKSFLYHFLLACTGVFFRYTLTIRRLRGFYLFHLNGFVP